MKKYLFILGLVCTALLTACSTADDLVADIPSQGLTEEEKAMIVEAGQDSDVPITLGTETERGMTRAPLDPYDNATKIFETPTGQYIGVFCLASGKQTGAPDFVPDGSTNSIYWNTHDYATWLDNVPAKVEKYDAGTGPLSEATNAYSYVSFLDSISLPTERSKVYYYPFGNWYHYDFFAYYPRQAKRNVWVGQGRVVVDFTIDGSQDIIVGKALGSAKAPINGVNAYSAKYMRLAGTENIPNLEFTDHKLTQLVFSIKPHFGDASDLKDKGYRLTGMKIIDVYNQLELYAAERGGQNGTLRIKNLSGTSDIPVRKTDGTDVPASSIIVSTDDDVAAVDAEHITSKPVGYAMVPTSDMLTTASKTNQYLVSIEMEQKDETGKYPGEDGYSGNPVPNTVVTLPLPEGGKYEAGKKYSITLEIYNPTNIQATATLVGWGDPVVIPAIPVE